MKFLVAAVVIIAIAGAATPASAQVNPRQHNQRDRILQVWRVGELTGREVARIGRQQYRIAHTEARMRAEGGGLSRRERARLDARQDRASARIYAQKHDRRDRW